MYTQARNILALGVAAIAAAACGGGSGSAASGPQFGSIQSVSVDQDTKVVVPIPVTAVGSMVSDLTITATPADGTLVLPQGIVLRKDGTTPALEITPAEDATGSTLINLQAKDPSGKVAKQSFTLTVKPVTLAFSTFAEGVILKSEDDQPLQVSGYTFQQDADSSTAFDATVAAGT